MSGICRIQTNIRGGERQSTARAYLDEAKGRRNLNIVTKTFVSRVGTCFKMSSLNIIIKYMYNVKEYVLSVELIYSYQHRLDFFNTFRYILDVGIK